MRKKGYKGRCEKKLLSKSKEVCRTYDPLQSKYADTLEESPEIQEIRCNVLLEGLAEGEYTSIVFNHLQSESLLERGFVNSRAKGTSNVTGTAMVTGHIPIKQANIASGNTTYKGSSGSSSGSSSSGGSSSGGSTAAYRANTNSVNANTSATDSNTKSAKESKSTIDFVKIKLDRLANTFEYAANQITDYVSSAFKTAVLKKQMKIIDKQLTANQEAYDTYMKKANSVGLSEEYKKLRLV